MENRSGDQRDGDNFSIFEDIDTDRSGVVEYSEFIAAGLERSLINSNQNLESIFNLLSDEDGFMTKDALAKVIISLRQKGQVLDGEEHKFDFDEAKQAQEKARD